MEELTGLVAAALRDRFGIHVGAIEPQPGGQDDEATVLRVIAGAAGAGDLPTHVAKVRPRRETGRLGPDVARYLQSEGLPLVVAPLPTRDGSTSADVGQFTITLYPFIDGEPGARVGLTDEQWTELGRFVRRLHAVELGPDLAVQLPVETFLPTGLDAMAQLLERMQHPGGGSGALESGVATWRPNRARIADLVRRTHLLSVRMRERSFAFVTCHADLHVLNVLVDRAGELHVVDWDEVVLAPRERDLMFFVGGISEEWMPSRGTGRFLGGYGRDVSIDGEAIAYYRHAWAVQDISSYTQRLLEEHRDESSRLEAAEILASLFRGGEIVELAERMGT